LRRRGIPSPGVNIRFNAVLFTLLMAYINGKIDGVNDKIAALNQRLDDMRDLWRAELRRVEEVLYARLKHLEER